MKAIVKSLTVDEVSYQALYFACPGCASFQKDYDGLHMLPVNVVLKNQPSWAWNGNLEKPTLSGMPGHSGSIKTESQYGLCHSFLTDGVFRFLRDSTHALAGKSVPIPDLPDWVSELSNEIED